MKSETEQLSLKELAQAKGRSYRWIMDVCRMGFQVPGGRSTLKALDSFLIRNPPPTRIRSVRAEKSQ